MKISIRNGSFETNSSSHHSLILTNERDFEKDKEEYLKKKSGRFRPYGGFCKPITTKEEKCYFLADMFNKENHEFNWMKDEYEVFIKILKDNKEEEILMNIELFRQKFMKSPYSEPPFCRKSFFNGTLDECDCCFKSVFKNYFKMSLRDDFFEKLLAIDISTDEGLKQLHALYEDETDKLSLYEKLYDFIYGDGIILPYESL